MNKMHLIIGLIISTVIITGCNSSNNFNSNNSNVDNESSISEAKIEDSNVDVSSSSKKTEVTGEGVTTPTIGGKVVITKQIQDQILSLAPSLYDYKAGDELTNEMRFAFVYYGYASGDLSRYTKKEIDMEGIKNTWAMIPETEVKNKFMNTFGVDIGDYKPKLNEDDPTVYYTNGYYYVCTTNPLMESIFSHLGNEDSVIKIKCQYVGESGYDEYKVTLAGANNSNGYVINKVTVTSK